MNISSKMKEMSAVMAVLALATAFPALARSVSQPDSVSDIRTSPDDADRQAKIALLSTVMGSNCTAVAGVMTPAAKQDWVSFLQTMKVDGKQYFLPDFCKVIYPLIGGHDENACLFGFFNPFYDAFMLFVVDKGEKARVSGFRFVRTAQLGGKEMDRNLAYPLAAGVTPCVDYFRVMLHEMNYARLRFHAVFTDDQFRNQLSELPLADSQTISDMQRVLKIRLGQVIEMSKGAEFSKICLARAILEKGQIGTSPVLSQDESTAKVLSALSGNVSPVRKDFTIVAYFADGEFSNFIFSNHQLKSVVVQAVVGADKKTRLKMFDMSQVGMHK